MERKIDRKFTLSADEVSKAVWKFLKEEHDIPVPDDPAKLCIIHELPACGKMEVSWTEHAILTTDTLR